MHHRRAYFAHKRLFYWIHKVTTLTQSSSVKCYRWLQLSESMLTLNYYCHHYENIRIINNQPGIVARNRFKMSAYSIELSYNVQVDIPSNWCHTLKLLPTLISFPGPCPTLSTVLVSLELVLISMKYNLTVLAYKQTIHLLSSAMSQTFSASCCVVY